METRKCLECEKHFPIPTAPTRKDRKKYCSYTCKQKGCWKLGLQKRADGQRGRGEGKTYTKLMGRHEHRVVMEKIIGRPLLSTEIVHHKDGNKKNNLPENLELMTKSEHTKMHSLEYFRRLKEKKICQN